jgi:hypothetical protein
VSAGTAVRPPASTTDPTRRRFEWPRDLALGIRLAVGGGRTSWARLVLGTIGIGMATAVLLIAASISHILAAEATRAAAIEPNSTPIPGVAPLHYEYSATEFRDSTINGHYLVVTGVNSPVPPGIPRLPRIDEIVLSPALQRLLGSPDGALLRPRFPQHVIGVISEPGLHGPQELTFYAGIAADEIDLQAFPELTYSFGVAPGTSRNDPSVTILLAVGTVALLIPILMMVSVSSRIAGAARDRRLAALRLVGAGARQVRRIAAAEAVVPAATGLVLGGVLFLIFRQILPHAQLFGESVFTDDVVPPASLIVLIVVLVPVLGVGSAVFALRGTVIEPLGVVRGGRPVRRRLWWRVGLVLIGVGLLVGAHWARADGPLWVYAPIAGTSALLIGVPVLLPYLLERGVSSIRGGAVSWQLAIRRLQLDSGTPARVVGGVAVVLAGAIALSTILVATSFRLAVPENRPQPAAGAYFVITHGSVTGQVVDSIERTTVVHGIYSMVAVQVSAAPTIPVSSIVIAACPTIRELAGPIACQDGDVFAQPDIQRVMVPGTRLTTILWPPTGEGVPKEFGTWTLPSRVHPLPTSSGSEFGPGTQLMVTPGAFTGVRLPPDRETWSLIHVDQNRPDAIEYVRNALAAHPLLALVVPLALPIQLSSDQQTYVNVRNGLLIGSLFTLGLAGVSLLVLALEQVRERRRPLAMLSAAGVSRAVLARSLLWQIAIPVGVGVLTAIATGIGLALLVLGLTRTSAVVDWADVGIFSVAAVVLVLLVTAATLPALYSATRLSSLRTE